MLNTITKSSAITSLTALMPTTLEACDGCTKPGPNFQDRETKGVFCTGCLEIIMSSEDDLDAASDRYTAEEAARNEEVFLNALTAASKRGPRREW